MEPSCGGARLSRRCHAGRATVTPMDVVAILVAGAAFALLLALIEGVDRV
ncbi:MAG: hypothetical protein LT070_13205 [Solirubrobacteraceae bacterium]|nr:hypothetical protein [Solirubrobacteraceae bacterium]